MFKYRKVKFRSQEKSPENEVRVAFMKPLRSYARYILGIFYDGKYDTVVIQGIGNVIPKCLGISDFIRRTIQDLHLIIEIKNIEIENVYEPLEEGLDKVVFSRSTASVKITLSKKQLDKTNPGYHEPLQNTEIYPSFGDFRRSRRSGFMRRGRRFNRGFERGGSWGFERRRSRFGSRRGGYDRGFGRRPGEFRRGRDFNPYPKQEFIETEEIPQSSFEKAIPEDVPMTGDFEVRRRRRFMPGAGFARRPRRYQGIKINVINNIFHRKFC